MMELDSAVQQARIHEGTSLQQQEEIALIEENLLDQSKELTRRVLDLQELYHAARNQSLAELESMRLENEALRQLLAERAERPMNEVSTGQSAARSDELAAEIAALRKQLQEKDDLLEDLRSRHTVAAGSSPEEVDAADYEAELNQFRRQLEADRQALNAEISHLRARNAELNEAAREAELELSRERAQLARERAQLDRLREEIRQELERAQRDAGVHERLAPLQRSKDENVDRQRVQDAGAGGPGRTPPGAANSSGRWRNFLQRLGDAP
jgi:hypothetical protein